jgi:Ca2+-binding EF-hand superfamily protein
MDPKKRWSADQALESHWLQKEFDLAQRRPSIDVMDNVASSLKSYSGKTKLQKMALMVVAHQSTTEEIVELRKAFDQYDAANNGTIQYGEFTEILGKMNYPKEEMEDIFASVDVDGSGNIHYTEFLAATLEAHGHIEEERLAEAFDRLDSDDSGFITKANLKEMLGTEYTSSAASALIAEADVNNDGRISWDEFRGMFERQQREAMKKAGLIDRKNTMDGSEEGLLGVNAEIPMG